MKTIYATITSQSSKGSTKSIKEVISILEDYKKSLTDNMAEFVGRLIDVGISVAQENTGDYGSYIQFTKRVEGTDEVLGVLIANSQEIPVTWKTSAGIKGYNVNPLLLAEFGSGKFAEVLFKEMEGTVGRGTMPYQKHAFAPNGWYWVDTEDHYHHSFGETPTHPMHKALTTMLTDIDRIAKEVFNG